MSLSYAQVFVKPVSVNMLIDVSLEPLECLESFLPTNDQPVTSLRVNGSQTKSFDSCITWYIQRNDTVRFVTWG